MKRFLAMFLAVALLSTLLFGCSSGSSQSSSAGGNTESGEASGTSAEEASSSGNGEPVTIQVAVSGSAQELDIHQQKFDLYTEEHPNVTIEPVDIGTERFQKLMTLIGSGTAPDIIYINEWCYSLAYRDVLMALDSFIEADEDFDLSYYPESLLVPLRYEDQLYALPQEVSPYVIYYNKDMFEAAGLEMPTDDWTIDEFYEAAKALTDPEKNVYGYRYASGADPFLGWLSRAGVDFDTSGTEVQGLDTQEALNALEFLYNLVVVDQISPNPAALTAMGTNADAMFRNQSVAMESMGLWMLPQYKADPLSFEWDVVRMPMDQNQRTKAGILNWGISADTKNPDAAWDLLKFLVGPESMEIVAESNMALPATTDEAANQIVLDTHFPENVQAFVDSVPDVDMADQVSIYRTEINTQIQELTDKMLIGESTPEETQQALIKEINAILAG
ncbi:MAG: ABC transporter substrate-binding protein [Acutalibacter sp.]